MRDAHQYVTNSLIIPYGMMVANGHMTFENAEKCYIRDMHNNIKNIEALLEIDEWIKFRYDFKNAYNLFLKSHPSYITRRV